MITSANLLVCSVFFVAHPASDHVAQAQQLLQRAVDSRDLAATAAGESKTAANQASTHERAALQAAVDAARQADAAKTARDRVETTRDEAHSAALEAKRHTSPAAKSSRERANEAWRATESAFQEAATAAVRAANHAGAAHDNAQAAKVGSDDAGRALNATAQAKIAADQAVGRARLLEQEIRQHVISGNGAAAEAALKKLDAEHRAAAAAKNEAVRQRNLATQAALSAAKHSQNAQTAKEDALAENRKAQIALQRASAAIVTARQSATDANLASLRSANAAPSYRASAQAAARDATDAATTAAKLARRAARLAREADSHATNAEDGAAAAEQERKVSDESLALARDAATDAQNAVVEASRRAASLDTSDDTADARAARRRVREAVMARDAANQAALGAAEDYNSAVLVAAEAANASSEAAAYARNAAQAEATVIDHTAKCTKARDDAAKAAAEAKAATDRVLDAVRHGDGVSANQAAVVAMEAKKRAQAYTRTAKYHQLEAEKAAAIVKHYAALASGAAQRIEDVRTRPAEKYPKAKGKVDPAVSKPSPRALDSTPNPFCFASAAHFPIREFGLCGEVIQREGLVIYEGMMFTFDRDGDYEVRFRATTPALPATVRLQFLIQPHRGGPWYTVTLAPIVFPYPESEAAKRKRECASDRDEPGVKQCCQPSREYVCKGRSETLPRCYAEMGKDASIRRTGSARFGHGPTHPSR